MMKAIKSSFCAAVSLGAPQATASLAGVASSPGSSSTYQIFLEAVRLVSISSRFCRLEIAKAGAGTELGKRAGLLVPAWWPRGVHWVIGHSRFGRRCSLMNTCAVKMKGSAVEMSLW